MDIQRSSRVGSVLAAVGASVCCLGPAVFGVLSAVFGTMAVEKTIRSSLTPLRPVFIGLSALALGAAFYTTYRPSRSTATGLQQAACPTTRSKMILWVVAGAVLILIASPYWLALFP